MLDAVAQRYGCRPSAVLRGSWHDYMLDVAVLTQALKHNEQTQPTETKRGAASRPDLSRTPQTFADPLETLPQYGNVGPIRTMAIPEDGIW
jgi:hypothetical protein